MLCVSFTLISILVTQEAVGTQDPELISMIIQHREYQRFTLDSRGITQILDTLEEVYNFLGLIISSSCINKSDITVI